MRFSLGLKLINREDKYNHCPPKNVIIAQGSQAWSEPEAPLKLTAATSTRASSTYLGTARPHPSAARPFNSKIAPPTSRPAPFAFREHRRRQRISSILPIMATGVDAKLLKSTKFPPEFSQKVDMTKVNLQVMKK